MYAREDQCDAFRCSLSLALALVPAATDFYPEVRSLLLEAEAALPGNIVMQDKSRPLQTFASLLARAGYLQDVMRVGAKAGLPPEDFAFAQTLYGDLDGAQAILFVEQTASQMLPAFCGIWETALTTVHRRSTT